MSIDGRSVHLLLDEQTYVKIISDEQFKEKYVMELRHSGFFKEHFETTELENCGTSEQQAALQPVATKKIWSPAATKLLISERLKLEDDFKKPQYKIKLWNKISSILQRYGHDFAPGECDSKWRNIMATYRSNLDKRSKTGIGCVRWEWFDMIHEIYGKEVSTQPPSAYTINSCTPFPSGTSTSLRNSESSATSSSSPTSSSSLQKKQDRYSEPFATSSSPTSFSPPSSLQRKRSRDSEPPLWFQSYLKKKHEEDKAKEKKEEERWNEMKELEEQKLKAMTSLLDILSKVVPQENTSSTSR